MARRASAARVKADWTYTVEEAAEAVGVTPQTVRRWIKEGLPAMTARRPTLILGCDLKEFVSTARASRKQPLQFGEFRCLRCKAARKPAFGIADYVPLSANHGRLEAFCADCGGGCSRAVSAAALPEWTALYGIGGNIGEHA